jgi:hypothetical protein
VQPPQRCEQDVATAMALAALPEVRVPEMPADAFVAAPSCTA